MPNYKPNKIAITSAAVAAASGSIMKRTLSTTTWKLYLFEGTALDPENNAISSGTVMIWLSTTAIGDPNYETFSDGSGHFAITLPVTNKGRTVKFIQ